MSLTNDTGTTMLVQPANCYGGGGGFGNMFGGDGLWFIILFLIFGMFGGGWGFGNGGFGGGMNGGVGSEVQRGFDHSSVVQKLDGITQGICDSTYALNNTATTGFANAELGAANRQAALIQQMFTMQAANQQCCCETQRAIDGINYNMATQACDTRNLIQTVARDITDNANANSRAILDFLTQDKIATLTAENQNLKLSASQANQNAVLMAAMDANKAEILRRSGYDCPVPAYVVQPPQPVTFQTNGCGTAYYGGYNGGCGCAA